MAMRIVGMWEIVSSPDFGDDHLNEEGTAYFGDFDRSSRSKVNASFGAM